MGWLLWVGILDSRAAAPNPELTIVDRAFFLDGQPFDMWGIRVASATQDEAQTQHLIDQLDAYRNHGVNTVTVFYQGSSGASYDPFSPDGRGLDAGHHERMERIIQACAVRDMVVVVGIYYQKAPFGLSDAAAVKEGVRTVTKLLRPYRNIIINVANEQNSRNWADEAEVFDFREPANIIELCRIVREEDADRLVGGGGYDADKNRIIGESPHVDVLLFDANQAIASVDLFRELTAGGKINKPFVNVEVFGGWTGRHPRGIFEPVVKAEFLRELHEAATTPGLYLFFFSAPWSQQEPMRYDLAGSGTAEDPGIRWFFEKLQHVKTGHRDGDALIQRDLPYAETPHGPQHLDLYLPLGHVPHRSANLPVVVWIHGGAWRGGSKNHGGHARRLVNRGYIVADINYRLSSTAIFPAAIQDSRAAIRWLRAQADTYGIDADRIGVMGSSAGGHLAALVGTSADVTAFDDENHQGHSSRVHAVVDMWGPTDFVQMDAHAHPDTRLVHSVAGSPESEFVGGLITQEPFRSVARQANPITHITPDDPPFYIIHGDSDLLVPVHQSILLDDALREAGIPVTLQVEVGAGHGRDKRWQQEQTFVGMLEFLDQHLK
ncbi:MAG: hypothetical protein SynsKO_02970 [Synoicihabitans sp.]